MPELRIIRNYVGVKDSHTIESYKSRDGYTAMSKALKKDPDDIIDEIKRAGLRGRGGAGFPTGVKWSFIQRDSKKPIYLCCNADESEPGSFKDREILEQDPHQMLEGIMIACYAINSHKAYVYIRGEMPYGASIIEGAIKEAYDNGYLGAYLSDGFSCGLLFQIAEELRQTFPRIFADHKLRQMWAHKYDSQLLGVERHADAAAVNVNFWITPDDANLNPDSGGLEVYLREAPLEWDFAKYNNDQEALREFVAGGDSAVIPYRQNRAVVFNSNLVHRTDAFQFKEGYENRRINITMLFGHRGQAPKL